MREYRGYWKEHISLTWWQALRRIFDHAREKTVVLASIEAGTVRYRGERSEAEGSEGRGGTLSCAPLLACRYSLASGQRLARGLEWNVAWRGSGAKSPAGGRARSPLRT